MPAHLSETKDSTEADLVVFYPIGIDWSDHFARCLRHAQRYVIVQCCLKTSGGTSEQWLPWWNGAECVWSYYDLSQYGRKNDSVTFNFYHAPLGLDPVFTIGNAIPDFLTGTSIRRPILTHGYVSGKGAERIVECWRAAFNADRIVVHIGGWPTSESYVEFSHVSPWEGTTDEFLARSYVSSSYVPSLREVEGFELPAAEALACGTRPVLFDQPDLRHWYGNSAVYVPEGLSDEDLIGRLTEIFMADPAPVPEEERQDILSRFSWEKIAQSFWDRVLS